MIVMAMLHLNTPVCDCVAYNVVPAFSMSSCSANGTSLSTLVLLCVG